MMTEQQILDLITLDGQPELDLGWNELTQRYAQQLAAISHKINRDDLAKMVVIGVVLYQKGLKEFRAGIDEGALFEALQKRQEDERKGK